MERLLIDAPHIAAQLFGPQNCHLALLSRISGAHLFNRGTTLYIDTADSSIAANLIKLFCTLHEQAKAGIPIAEDRLEALYSRMAHGEDTTQKAQKQKTRELSACIETPKKCVQARNPAQERYIDLLKKHDIVFALGAAGTGKTYLAVAYAVHLLLQHTVKRIVLTRPAVEAGEKLGFLPGDLAEKIDPYLRPLYDALYDMLSKPKVMALVELGSIEVAPLAFMRGRTLHEACIILDEAQNTTREQMKMFLTRMGFGSRMIITGDCTQIDLPHEANGQQSGLIHAARILQNIPAIAFHTFTREDVVRHHLVGEIVNAYELDENRNTQT
ncbi:MAG: PhoH family protein [Desulfovibrionaceae bacterium]|nr:PhoH family protein [Desulfovibrionaceae bacterium]